MVHKRYVWKNGKRFGPYYYESYREGNKIRKKYIGSSIAKNNSLGLYLIFGLILVILLAFFFIWKGTLTGKVVAGVDEFYSYSYTFGESLRGNFKIFLLAGELMPENSKVIVQIGNQTREMFLYEVASAQRETGDYYLGGSNLSGSGKGFGAKGRKEVYPLVNFELEVFDDLEDNKKENNSSVQSDGSGQDISEVLENDLETNQNFSSDDSDIQNQSSVVEGDVERPSDLITPQADEESAPLESIESEPVQDQSKADSSSEGADEEKSASSSESDVEIKQDNPDAKGENKESNGENEQSETKGPSTEEGTSLISGAAISEKEESDKIKGVVSRGQDYSYELGKKKNVRIVPGSVKVNGTGINDGLVFLSVINGVTRVVTNYSMIEEGFGPDYLGENFSLMINLTKFNISVYDSNLKIEISLDNIPIRNFEETLNLRMNEGSDPNNNSLDTSIPENWTNVTLPGNITNITLPGNITNTTLIQNLSNITYLNETNLTFMNETNLTIFNFSNFTQNLSILKEIVFLKIEGNESLKINLSDYFLGAEGYNFTGRNILWDFADQMLTLKADGDFRGYTQARILAYQGNESLESKEIAILVSSGDLRISTLRDRIVIGRPVRWVKNITNNVIENVTIELPAEALNVSVIKISKDKQIRSSSVSISGNVVYGEGEGGLLLFVKSLWAKFRGSSINANVVADDSFKLREKKNIAVKLTDDSDKYLLEYYTAPPVVLEREYSGGKHIYISAPDSLNYTDVIAFTALDNNLGIKSAEDVRVKWYDSERFPTETKNVANVPNLSEIENTADLLDLSGGDLESSVKEEGVIVSINVSSDNLDMIGTSSLKENSSLILGEDRAVNAGSDLVYTLREVPFELEDYDLDGNMDHIFWVVPHFSNQSYEVTFTVQNTYSSGIIFDGDYAHLQLSDNAPALQTGYGQTGYGSFAYWNFDGDNASTAFDYSGYNLDGVYVNAVSNETQCVYGSCAKFNGQAYINLSESEFFDFSRGNQFTYAAWINPSSLSQSYNMIMGHYLPYFNVRSTGKLHLNLYAGGAQRSIYGPTTLSIGNWHHVAATYNASGYLHLYLNGVLENVTGPYTPIASYSSNMYIGSWTDSLSYNFTGLIDEAIISNQSMNSSQIFDIYQNQSARYTSPAMLDGKQHLLNIGQSGYGVTTFNTFNYQRKLGTNISVRLGTWSVGQGYKNWDLGEHVLKLDGVNDYINISSDSILSLAGREKQTVSMWANWDRVVTNSTLYAETLYDGWWRFSLSTFGLDAVCAPTQLRFTTRDTSSGDEGTRETLCLHTPSVDQWYHYVLVYDNVTGVKQFYINGVLFNSTSESVDKFTSTSAEAITIGGDELNQYYFNGSIDEVTVFNRTLNESEIIKIYEAGRDSAELEDSSLVSRWEFNDGSANDTQGLHNASFVYGAYVEHDNQGLMGYWHFDSDYEDYSGNNQDGTAIGTHLNFSGIYNSSATFNGSGEYVSIPSWNDALLNNTATISTWIYLKGTPTYYDGIVGSTNGAAGQYNWLLGIGADRKLSLKGWVGTAIPINFSSVIPLNTWTHIAVTYDKPGNKAFLYVNGVQGLEYSVPFNGLYNNLDANLQIASYNYAGTATRTLNGSLDEMMIFNRSLTSSEVAELYSKGRARWGYTGSQNLKAVDSYDNWSSNTFQLPFNTVTNILPSYKLSSDSYYFYTPLVSSAWNITLNTVNSNVTVCNSTSGCLFIRNSSNMNLAIFDKFGNVDILGDLGAGSVGTPDGQDFIIKNGSDSVVAWIDGSRGNLKLAGSLIADTRIYCTAPANSFVIKDSAGNCVSYIDNSGNLWAKGLFNPNAII